MNKRILFIICIFLPFIAHSQHFEWAKGYNSFEFGCSYIRGSVTDGEGNLYILGQCTADARWDDEYILPLEAHAEDMNSICAIIAKISPSGEMVWKKIVHSGNYQSAHAFGIKRLGDTAVACMLNVSLPTPYDYYCYYLDTLLVGWSDYPIPLEYATFSNSMFTAYVVLDFSGRIIEQHFLQVSFVDSAGNDCLLTHGNANIPDKLCLLELQNVSFDVDEDGNIYVLREALDILDDTTSVEVETMSGVRLWVDQQCVGTVMVDGGEHPRWSPQVLKFSPGFDTLLAARYIFDGGQVGCEMYPTYMKIGPDSKVYCINTIINIDGIGTIVVDSVQGMMLEYGNSDLMSVMVRLDGELNREWMLTVEDSVINPQMGLILTSQFYDIDFDKDSNLLFLSITAGKWSPGKNESRYSTLLVDGVPLRIGNDMAVLVFENATEVPRLRSYGVVPSVAASAYVSNSTGNLACANGRVFVQSGFSGGLRIPGNEDIGSSIYYTGSGLTIFDYNGRVIGGGSYHTSSPYSRPGFLRLQDSVLYLGMSLYDDNATFGDMTIHGNGIFSAVVKYVDTAFMSPYQAPEGGETLITDVEEPHILLYPNPFSRQVTVKLQGVASVAKTAWLTHPGGRCEPIPLVFDEAGFYTLDLAQKPDGMYYLSFKTYSGSLYTFVLLKMEN